MDFFVVPRVTFRILYVLVVMSHERRKVVHFSITDAPTAAWTAQQIINAFPYATAPRYLLRDRDSIYGSRFVQRVEGMGITQKLISPRSPWQNPFVERLIGSIRRECLDHIIVLGEKHLHRTLTEFFDYYHGHIAHTARWIRILLFPAVWNLRPMEELLSCRCSVACIIATLVRLLEVFRLALDGDWTGQRSKASSAPSP